MVGRGHVSMGGRNSWGRLCVAWPAGPLGQGIGDAVGGSAELLRERYFLQNHFTNLVECEKHLSYVGLD